MRRQRRRAVLAGLATVGLGGCLDTSGTDDSTPDSDGGAGDGTPTSDDSTSDDSTSDDSTSDDSTSDDSMSDDSTSDDSTSDDSTSDDSTSDDSTPDSDGGAGDGTPTPDDSTPTPGEESELAGYETTRVSVRTPGDELLGVVYAAIADTSSLRYTGLSDVEDLGENFGMLFVFDRADEYTFVMREMDFGLDIVFANADGTITTVHHASEPGPDEDGSAQHYPGYGQYVLEVNIDWTTDRGVEEGDVLDFDL